MTPPFTPSARAEAIYTRISEALRQHAIPHKTYTHRVLTSYEDAEAIGQELGWNGTESKSCYLISRSSKTALVATLQGRRIDTKRLAELTGEKFSFVEDLEARTGCVPGNVPPLGLMCDWHFFEADIAKCEAILFSPGIPTATLELAGTDLVRLLVAVGAQAL